MGILVEFFVNICIVITLLFAYLQLRWNKLEGTYSRKVMTIIDGLAGGILGNILMYFSIQVTDQTIVDLRHIPVIILFLFIGFKPAILSGLLIIAGRFIYGINASSIGALLLMICLLVGFYFIRRQHRKEGHLFKEAMIMLVHSNLVFLIVIAVLVQNWNLLKSLIPIYWAISFVGGLLSVFVVNYLRNSHELFKKYEEQSTVDYLTGLNNVREFDKAGNTLFNQAQKDDLRLSLLMIDIDYFKQVNDTYGHSSGDLVLQQLGEVLKENARSFDVVSRNGGEEFSVILQDCSKERALEIAERIRSAVQNHSFTISNGETISITVSIGASTYPNKVTSIDEMIKQADQSLYSAKRNGRNCVKSA
ncbi:diguanylate cyclase [Halobacillus locisalis]|uniref:Diguanylate cyclase n=1 Tax=Halobacillus locisalis TaxID=220753 RepID=A0A838CUM8_9BACI|nr:diguanylate cyclase [Halobacillus locisalis]MBA2175852.1 diguanylate cyclase [Halobacillus locisalis]